MSQWRKQRLRRLCRAVCFGAWAYASVASAETTQLGESVFWIGEDHASANLERPFVVLDNVDWIAEVFEADPALSRAIVVVEDVESLQPRAEQLEYWVNWHELAGLNSIDPVFVSEHFDLYVPRSGSLSELLYVPKADTAPYHFRCFLKDAKDAFSFCGVSSDYPPDPGVRIRTRLYFPPNFLEEPDFFHDVATGALAFVECLDTTGRDEGSLDEVKIMVECDF